MGEKELHPTNPACPRCARSMTFITLRELRALCPPGQETWGYWICRPCLKENL